MTHRMQLPKLKASIIALSAALTAMAPAVALAAPASCRTGLSTHVTTTVNWSSGNCTITSSGSIVVSTTHSSGLAASGNNTSGVLTNSGTITGLTYGINNTGKIGILDNISGTISATDTPGASYGIINTASATITTLTNEVSGTIGARIKGDYAGIDNLGLIKTLNNKIGAVISSSGFSAILNSGSITSLNNDGTIGSAGIGLFNTGGKIGTLTNSGLISSQGSGIGNSSTGTIGTIGSLSNSGIISTSSGNGIFNAGAKITTLTNSGLISSGGIGIANTTNGTAGSIGSLSNSGMISSSKAGIYNNAGTITALTNDGAINSSNDNGISNNAGTIGTLINNGTISSSNNNGTINTGTGIFNNGGMIGTLTNTGLIKGVANAIFNAGTIGPIANNGGTIAGNITNTVSRDLTLIGGTGSTFGILTGFGGGIDAGNVGTIANTASNLVFAAGNQLLNDTIDVTGHTVINSGSTLQVNNTIAITGNYTQNAAATLNIGVGDGAITTSVVSADSGYGRLVISGNATFDAGTGIALKKLNTYAFAQGQRFVVVQAANANAHYNAGSLNYSAIGYSAAPVTGASVTDSDNAALTDLVLTVGTYVPPPPSNPTGPATPPVPVNSATDPGAVASLAGLFNYTGTNANMLNLFNAAAATGGSIEANRAGEQLSPSGTGAALVQSVQVSTQAVINVTSSHIDAIRVAQAAGSGDSGIATGERPGDVAVWGQAFGGQANQSDRPGASGYRAGYNGMLIGADTAIGDQWRAGGLISYANTSIASTGNNTGSSGHVSSYGLTGYAGYAAEKWYLDLSAGAVQQKYNTLRSVDFSGFSGGASGQFDGMQYIASAQAGYPIKLDAMTTLTPIGGLTYSRLHQDGYTETGSAVALQIGSASTSSIKSDLGAKLDRSFKTSYGDMTPSAQLSWRHEYRNTGLQSVGNFAADTTGTTSFTTQGAAPTKDTGVLVLGVTLARSQNLTLAAHYTLEAASGYTAQTADVRLRYQF